jgi:hypothetical protein
LLPVEYDWMNEIESLSRRWTSKHKNYNTQNSHKFIQLKNNGMKISYFYEFLIVIVDDKTGTVVINSNLYVGFEVFTTVTMKNDVFWYVAPCRSCVNRRFGGMYRLHLQCRKICERGTSMSRWQQNEPPVENTQLYKNRRREGGRVVHMGSQ